MTQLQPGLNNFLAAPAGLMASPALQERLPADVILDPTHFQANAQEALRDGVWGDKRRIAIGMPGETTEQMLGLPPKGVKTKVDDDVLLVRLLDNKDPNAVVTQENMTQSIRLALMLERRRAEGRFILKSAGVLAATFLGMEVASRAAEMPVLGSIGHIALLGTVLVGIARAVLKVPEQSPTLRAMPHPVEWVSAQTPPPPAPA